MSVDIGLLLPTDIADDQDGRRGWRPMKGAPKDGRSVLVTFWHNDERLVGIASWQHGWIQEASTDPLIAPIAWMPLPEPAARMAFVHAPEVT